MMQIPKIPKKQKSVEKKCQYNGCEKPFQGIHGSKYCPEHKDPTTRVKVKPAVEDVSVNNQVINHDYSEVKTMIMVCGLEGCKEQFEFKLYPRQFVYPKFCPEHRNEHKRQKRI